jgi:hypothetical protein
VVNQADVDILVYDVFGTNYGDANLDGQVNIDDFSVLLSHWGMTGAGWAEGDFDGNGCVTIDDFSLLLQNWGFSGY